MSSLSLRRALIGALVMSFLFLAGPLPGEAAGFSEPPASPWVLTLAWQWLAQIFSADEIAGSAAVAPDQNAVDAGWVIDPDG